MTKYAIYAALLLAAMTAQVVAQQLVCKAWEGSPGEGAMLQYTGRNTCAVGDQWTKAPGQACACRVVNYGPLVWGRLIVGWQ